LDGEADGRKQYDKFNVQKSNNMALTEKEEMQQTRHNTAQLHPTSEYVEQSHRMSMASLVLDAEFHVSASCPNNQKHNKNFMRINLHKIAL